MERKNYYAILGISPSESGEGVRAAYRRLAKECHPDVAGEEKTGYFREITEAYLVLSGDESRKAYDQAASIPKAQSPFPQEPPLAGEKGGRPRWTREPAGDSPPGVRDSVPGRNPFHGFGSDRDMMGNFFSRPLGHPMEIEVLLTREEARRGGVLPLELPLVQLCPFCQGRGPGHRAPCSRCGGRGTVLQETPVRVRVPENIEDGTRLELRFKSRGGREEEVFLRFLIQ